MALNFSTRTGFKSGIEKTGAMHAREGVGNADDMQWSNSAIPGARHIGTMTYSSIARWRERPKGATMFKLRHFAEDVSVRRKFSGSEAIGLHASNQQKIYRQCKPSRPQGSHRT